MKPVTLIRLGARAILLFLRVAVLLQCIGAARGITLDGTPLASVLFVELGVAEPLTRGLNQGIAATLILLGCMAALKPTRGVLYAAAGWFALDALFTAYWGGAFGAELAPAARAVRYLAPVALVLLSREQAERAERLLVMGACAVFAAHGLECLLSNPRFIDYIIVVVGTSQTTAETMLLVIGVIDVALAVAILFRRTRFVLGYMLLWGFATAGMRMFYYGVEAGYHHTLIRIFNGGAPLVLMAMMVVTARVDERVVAWQQR